MQQQQQPQQQIAPDIAARLHELAHQRRQRVARGQPLAARRQPGLANLKQPLHIYTLRVYKHIVAAPT